MRLTANISLLILVSIGTALQEALAFAPSLPLRYTRPTATSSVASPQRPSWAPVVAPQVLFMGWGPDPIWSTATVTAKSDACNSGRSVLLTVDVPPETAAEYKIPGVHRKVSFHTNVITRHASSH